MVSAMVAELQFVCASAESQPHDLVPETDSKNRFLSHQLPHVPDGVIDSLRISRPIRKKYPVGLQLQDILSARLRRNDGDARSTVDQIPQDVRFDSEIIGNDVKLT